MTESSSLDAVLSEHQRFADRISEGAKIVGYMAAIHDMWLWVDSDKTMAQLLLKLKEMENSAMKRFNEYQTEEKV